MKYQTYPKSTKIDKLEERICIYHIPIHGAGKNIK